MSIQHYGVPPIMKHLKNFRHGGAFLLTLKMDSPSFMCSLAHDRSERDTLGWISGRRGAFHSIAEEILNAAMMEGKEVPSGRNVLSDTKLRT